MRVLRALFVIAVWGVGWGWAEEQSIPGPSFEDVLSLEGIGPVSISADGETVAYGVTSTDWEDNRYHREIWVARPGSGGGAGETFQLTNSDKGSSSPDFAPSGTLLAFLSNRGDDNTLHIIDTRGGEARLATDFDGSIGSFRWSPDGKRIAFVGSPKKSDQQKRREARKKKFGDFAGEDEELTYSHLWVTDVAEPGAELPKAQQLTSGEDFTVGSFAWSPSAEVIAFDHRPRPVIDDFVRSDISTVTVASGKVTPLVKAEGPDSGPLYSPDGSRIAFVTSGGNDPYFGNRLLASVPAGGGGLVVATTDFDENPSPFAWTDAGIWFTASQRTERSVFRATMDMEGADSGKVTSIEQIPLSQPIVGSVSLTPSGARIAYTAQGPTRTSELYTLDLIHRRGEPAGPRRHTDQQAAIADWPLGTREIIRWKSKDGSEIEGVLMLPEGHDRSTPAPLMVVIHGGPTGTSRPTLVSSYVYPVTQWLAKGAIVMMPNYRGSAGYGAAFRALNVRNLGVGDAWDVESGVQYLIDQGLADKDKVGGMGWSQGGYISAFLATTSDMFQALSNGAGISDWMTYYVNTDIHGFTRSYLKGTPWDDPEIYRKTSPISYIENAQTPTLIQHGENDQRVPVPNAYELYQGLQDQGVDTRLVIYKDFGHGINRPKERLAATWHNWQWFAKYIWGEEVQLPVDVEDETEDRDASDSSDTDTDAEGESEDA